MTSCYCYQQIAYCYCYVNQSGLDIVMSINQVLLLFWPIRYCYCYVKQSGLDIVMPTNQVLPLLCQPIRSCYCYVNQSGFVIDLLLCQPIRSCHCYAIQWRLVIVISQSGIDIVISTNPVLLSSPENWILNNLYIVGPKPLRLRHSERQSFIPKLSVNTELLRILPIATD